MVIVCVSTYDVVHQVLDPLAADVEGRTPLNLTSGTPEEARRAASWAAAHGADYLDGAIMGVPQMIGLPGTLLLHGGPRKTFDAQEPLLRVLGGANTYLGDDPGLPLLYDMGRCSRCCTRPGRGSPTHRPWSARRASPRQSSSRTRPTCSTRCSPGSSTPRAPASSTRRTTPPRSPTSPPTSWPSATSIRTSRELGLPTDWLAPVQAGLDRAVREGHAADNPARLIEYVRPDSP